MSGEEKAAAVNEICGGPSRKEASSLGLSRMTDSARAKLPEHRPGGWTQPQFTSYAETLWSNTLATFANKKEAHRLCRLDDLMFEIAKDWIAHQYSIAAIVPLLMFFRAHSAFRSATILGMGGAVVESMPVLRLSLEFSGYAAIAQQDAKLAQLWFDRDTSDSNKQTVRKAFTNGAVRKAIEKYDLKTSKAYSDLYERTIQFGGHPNEKAITTSLKISKTTKDLQLEQVYLQGDGIVMDHWLRMTNQIGVAILKIFGHVLHERFDLLGARRKLSELVAGL